MDILAKYKNGNTSVTILTDGTKIREWDGIPNIVHPESIDVKITDYCDMGCAYCHESSTKAGKHSDLDKLLNVLIDLPAGVELAIGGGNPLSHPDLMPFLTTLKLRGIIANLTVNQGHIQPHMGLIKEIISSGLANGIGVSITSNNFKYIREVKKLSDNIVYHVIAGVNDISILDNLIAIGNCKVLVLGYKQFGFGVDYFSKEVALSINKWKKSLPSFIGKAVLSFDNLAIEQLNIKRVFTHSGWEKFYMGDDFTFTQYIDAVKQEYSPTSRSKDRCSFSNYSLLAYFNKFKHP